MKKSTYRCFVYGLLLLAGTVTAVSAADNKVVVVPLNSGGSNNSVLGGYGIRGILLDAANNIYMAAGTVTLPADGKCVVTISGFVNGMDAADVTNGPALMVARQTGLGTPVTATWASSPLLKITSADIAFTSTSGSVTSRWVMNANTTYTFGCGFIGNPVSWQDDTGTCNITWVCDVD